MSILTVRGLLMPKVCCHYIDCASPCKYGHRQAEVLVVAQHLKKDKDELLRLMAKAVEVGNVSAMQILGAVMLLCSEASSG